MEDVFTQRAEGVLENRRSVLGKREDFHGYMASVQAQGMEGSIRVGALDFLPSGVSWGAFKKTNT